MKFINCNLYPFRGPAERHHCMTQQILEMKPNCDLYIYNGQGGRPVSVHVMGGGGGGGGGLRLTQCYTGNLTIFFQRISHQFLQPLPVQNRKIEILCQPCCRTERSCRSCCNQDNEGRSFWLLKRQSNGSI